MILGCSNVSDIVLWVTNPCESYESESLKASDPNKALPVEPSRRVLAFEDRPGGHDWHWLVSRRKNCPSAQMLIGATNSTTVKFAACVVAGVEVVQETVRVIEADSIT